MVSRVTAEQSLGGSDLILQFGEAREREREREREKKGSVQTNT